MTQNTSQTDVVLESLTWGNFPEHTDAIRACLNELETLEDSPDKVIQSAADSLKGIWKNYTDEETADIFRDFAGVQRALFGLEYEEGSPRRYREHILHMFHVFIMGARFLSLGESR